MEKQLLVSRIQTPDGTILTSRHVHDFVTHKDKNGLEYMLDGGTDYQRYYINEEAPHINISIYTDSPFELIREHYCRGTYGKEGNEAFRWIPLSKMTNEHLENCIIHNYENTGKIFSLPNSYYMQELIYRRDNDIHIADEIE